MIMESVNVVMDDFKKAIKMTHDDEILSNKGTEDQTAEKQFVEDSVATPTEID